MAEIHRLPDIDEVERQASEWIARLHADDVSPADRGEFDKWRAEHPLHAQLYADLQASLAEFTAARPLVRAVWFGHSMNEAAKRGVTPWRPLLVAATAALVVVIALRFLWQTPGSAFQSAIGEHLTVSLSDGSVLELNSNSFARVDYSEHARVIHLERGEAYFKVAHDPSRPFWVVGGGSWVRAVGTEFNVNLRPAGVRVTVSEGTVKVGAAGFSLSGGSPADSPRDAAAASVLSAGEQVDVQGKSALVRRLPAAEITRTGAWRSGTVYFENQPLSDVVAELSRYTTLQLIVNDQHLRSLPIGGVFQASSQGPETLLALLRDGFGLSIRRDSNYVYIENADQSLH